MANSTTIELTGFMPRLCFCCSQCNLCDRLHRTGCPHFGGSVIRILVKPVSVAPVISGKPLMYQRFRV